MRYWVHRKSLTSDTLEPRTHGAIEREEEKQQKKTRRWWNNGDPQSNYEPRYGTCFPTRARVNSQWGIFSIKTRHKEDITEGTHVSLCLLTRCIVGGTTMMSKDSTSRRNTVTRALPSSRWSKQSKQESQLQQHYSGQLQPNCKSEDADVRLRSFLNVEWKRQTLNATGHRETSAEREWNIKVAFSWVHIASINTKIFN